MDTDASLQTEAQKAGEQFRSFLLGKGGQGAGPRFESVSALSKRMEEAVTASPKKLQSGNAANQMAKVFKGEIQPSKQMAEALEAAFKTRFADSGNVERELSWLRRHIKRIKQAHLRDSLDELGLPAELEDASEQANNRFVITPFEQGNRSSGNIPLLRSVMFTRLKDPRARYIIAMSSYLEALDFWRVALHGVAKALRNDTPHDIQGDSGLPPFDEGAVETLQGYEENDQIRVYVAHQFLLLNTSILYDPDQDTCRGFSINFGGGNRLHIEEIHPPYLGRWREFYADFVINGTILDQKPRRVLFSQVKEELIREAYSRGLERQAPIEPAS